MHTTTHPTPDSAAIITAAKDAALSNYEQAFTFDIDEWELIAEAMRVRGFPTTNAMGYFRRLVEEDAGLTKRRPRRGGSH